MKREPWSIGCAFAYGIRIVNSIFCCKPDEPGWTEEEKEMGEDNKWLVVEQVNSMCSQMMIEDAHDILQMAASLPNNRLCEQLDCKYHHSEDYAKHDYKIFQSKCDECSRNKKSKVESADQFDYFESYT